jgi:hypothetical protein
MRQSADDSSALLHDIGGALVHVERRQQVEEKWLGHAELPTLAACCHTRFSEENQVLNYMDARIKFHTYSDIIVINRNNIT